MISFCFHTKRITSQSTITKHKRVKRLKRIKLQAQINQMMPLPLTNTHTHTYTLKESIHKHNWFKWFRPISTLKESNRKWFRSVSCKLLLLFIFLLEAWLQRTKYTRTKETTNYRNRVRTGRISSVQTVMSDEPNESPEIKGVTMRANLKSLPPPFSSAHNRGVKGGSSSPRKSPSTASVSRLCRHCAGADRVTSG